MISSIVIAAVLLAFLKQILFAAESWLCRLLDLLYEMFGSLAGINPVWQDGRETTLLDVFFSNELVTTVYWCMACIGFALTFGFAIASLVRKVFDSTGEKVKATIGQILTNTFKAILIILLMTAIVSATISGTTALLTAVDDAFNNAEEISNPTTIEFDEADMAGMFKIIDMIGNCSISPAYDNRFNINSCFNQIRPYMQTLEQRRMFEYSYEGAESSWQYWLTQIYMSSNIYQDVKLDDYNEALSNAILGTINQIKTNKDNFKPLKSYSRNYNLSGVGAGLGRVLMLSCSFNEDSGSKASLTDSRRRPFYTGSKDIYDYDTVCNSFDYGLLTWNHIVNLIGVFIMIKEFLKILINCIARIFNILVLYITAPGFISVMPLDDGGKFKQWITAFVIQSLQIFGSVVAVRLLMIMMPVVLSPGLVIFNNSFGNILAKDVVIIGMCFTAEKASGLISGILADNAGYQSIMAGDVGNSMVSRGMALAGRAIGGVASAGFGAAKGALGGLATASGARTLGDMAGSKMKNLGQSMRDKGGIIGAVKGGWTTNEQDSKDQADKEAKAEKADTKDFREAVLSRMGGGQQGSQPGVAQNPPVINNQAPQPAPQNNNVQVNDYDELNNDDWSNIDLK